MSKNYGSYQKLGLDAKYGVYVDKQPQRVLAMEDPYNPWSYYSYVGIECSTPSNKQLPVLENYRKRRNRDFDLIEYENFQ